MTYSKYNFYIFIYKNCIILIIMIKPDTMDLFNVFNPNSNTNILEISSNDFINYIQAQMLIKLECILPHDSKGPELHNNLNQLKMAMNLIFESFDEKIKNVNKKTTIIALKAQISVGIDILNKMLFEYSKNKNLTYIDYLKLVTPIINTENKEKKRKIKSTNLKNANSKKMKKNDSPDNNTNNITNIINIGNLEEEYDDNDDDDDDDGEDEDDDDDDDDYDDDCANPLNNQRPPRQSNVKYKEDKEFIDELIKNNMVDNNGTILNYFTKLNKVEKSKALKLLKEVNNYQITDTPLLFTIIMLDIPIMQKNHILKKYLNMISSKGESIKLKTWVESIMTVPFGIFSGINLKMLTSAEIKKFLNNLQDTMDKAVWGHNEAKRHIIQIMGQQFRNPDSKGNMIGIWGPPGNGKTTLIKEGIAKAMNKPFVFISLGGATDSSFLEGHSYTYEGSIYGRIAQGLINSKCMDPIIYFDELDKISKTAKGEEITNLLIHLTDPVQNTHFRDKYFHGVDLDLSRVTFIFSYNDPSLVDRVLMDRISQVETKYLLQNQKIYIAQNYLICNILKEVGLNTNSIIFTDEIICSLINNYTHEGGVRKLKEYIYNIVRELNISNLTKTKINNKSINFPFTLTQEIVTTILKNKHVNEPEKIHTLDKCGIINGMYATSAGGIGGIMPIEILWMPSNSPFEIKATGNLQQVIKESTQVASTLAFNHLSKEKQEYYLKEWKERPKGLHIHCPDGSVPKDGPSAGTALTVAIYSILNDKKIKHDIAITGEINLQGKVTAIGGLENKLEGAKKAGVRLALYPKENEKDIERIKERNPTLIDDVLQIKAIDTIEEAIQYALV